MVYRVIWDKKSLDDLRKLPFAVALPLKSKIESYLVKSPLALGKPLTGKYKGLYRYRYGDYRIIYEIAKQNNLIITKIGHRSEIY